MTVLISLAANLFAHEKKKADISAAPKFDDVYQEHFSFAWRSLRGLGVPSEAVEDAAQEVFIIVYRKLDMLTDPAGIKGWIFSISRRVASDYRRSKKRKGIAVEYNDSTTKDENSTPQVTAENRQMLEQVESFLSGLKDENRSIFVLSEVEQLPVSQISQMMDMNLNTIYSRLKVIKNDLEKYMTKQETGLKAGRK